MNKKKPCKRHDSWQIPLYRLLSRWHTLRTPPFPYTPPASWHFHAAIRNLQQTGPRECPYNSWNRPEVCLPPRPWCLRVPILWRLAAGFLLFWLLCCSVVVSYVSLLYICFYIFLSFFFFSSLFFLGLLGGNLVIDFNLVYIHW